MPAMVSFRGEECLGANVRLRALSTDSHVHEQLRKSTCITKPRRVTVNLPPGHLPRTLAPPNIADICPRLELGLELQGNSCRVIRLVKVSIIRMSVRGYGL